MSTPRIRRRRASAPRWTSSRNRSSQSVIRCGRWTDSTSTTSVAAGRCAGGSAVPPTRSDPISVSGIPAASTTWPSDDVPSNGIANSVQRRAGAGRATAPEPPATRARAPPDDRPVRPHLGDESAARRTAARPAVRSGRRRRGGRGCPSRRSCRARSPRRQPPPPPRRPPPPNRRRTRRCARPAGSRRARGCRGRSRSTRHRRVGGDQRCTSSRASRSASCASASACCASRSASTGAERASPTAVSRCRWASASRVRASLPTAPRRVAMKSDAAAIPDRAASSVRSSWAAARSPASRASWASASASSSAVPASSSRRSAASGSPPPEPSGY